MVEIYNTTKQTRRRFDCLLIETKQITAANETKTLPVNSIPPYVTNVLYKSLGFIDTASLDTSMRGRSPAEQRRFILRRDHQMSTFVFVDKEFWICSVDIGFAHDHETEIVKHFFLPREWQNAEWLDMAMVTTSGDVLCPRNGTVAVVSNGLIAEFDGQD
jgi:hypothetical protein